MYVEGQDNIVGQPQRSGLTALQTKQLTEGSPEKALVDREKLRSEMRPLKKALIGFKMDAVQGAYNKAEELVHKSVDAIASMEVLKSQIKSFAPDYFRSEK
ncbi:unnamed protein product [marine sediment metagenome]|uniref:Uncharacterized protein n=1 Tax=marine sediment metagenome TaxID=412755 RepID=X1JQF5_9ZZZZ